ncbi:iron-sulfur cluster-binding protein [Candidatus Hakubella thermalkaliphila]
MPKNIPPFLILGQEKNSELKTQNSKLTYKRVCKEGPVFSAEEIVWI